MEFQETVLSGRKTVPEASVYKKECRTQLPYPDRDWKKHSLQLEKQVDERVDLKGIKILARVFGKRWRVTGEFYFPVFSFHHFYVHVKKKMSASFTCQSVLRTKLLNDNESQIPNSHIPRTASYPC